MTAYAHTAKGLKQKENNNALKLELRFKIAHYFCQYIKCVQFF